MIEAFSAASKEGKGVVTVDNKLVENMHVTEANRVLRQHEIIESLQNS